MHEWTVAAGDRIAAGVEEDAAAYALTAVDIDGLLDLARVAAHDSERKSNAPLVSYLVGVAHARHPDRRLDELIRIALGDAAASL